MSRVAPGECPRILDSLKAVDPTLDRFALHYLGGGWDSTNGTYYGLPRDTALHDVFCSLTDLESHASGRLQDASLHYPARAAWRAVIERKSLYGVDGTEVRH